MTSVVAVPIAIDAAVATSTDGQRVVKCDVALFAQGEKSGKCFDDVKRPNEKCAALRFVK